MRADHVRPMAVIRIKYEREKKWRETYYAESGFELGVDGAVLRHGRGAIDVHVLSLVEACSLQRRLDLLDPFEINQP